MSSPPSPLSHTRIARTVIQRHHSGSNRLCDDYPDFKHDRMTHDCTATVAPRKILESRSDIIPLDPLLVLQHESINILQHSFVSKRGNGINEKCAITVELSVRPPPKIRRFNGSLTKIKPQLSLSRRGAETPTFWKRTYCLVMMRVFPCCF